MHSIIVWSVHAFVHHEYTGLDCGAFTRLEYHRTDGQLRRSAPLQYFNVGIFFEAQSPVTGVGDFDGKGFVRVELYGAKVDFLLIHRDGWSSTRISPAALIRKEKRGRDQEEAAKYHKRPGKCVSLFSSFILFANFTHWFTL
jgi:hypothetical protein